MQRKNAYGSLSFLHKDSDQPHRNHDGYGVIMIKRCSFSPEGITCSGVGVKKGHNLLFFLFIRRKDQSTKKKYPCGRVCLSDLNHFWYPTLRFLTGAHFHNNTLLGVVNGTTWSRKHWRAPFSSIGIRAVVQSG